MAGRIQIITRGHTSDLLLDNPSFSFFTKKYNKHTNWANENFKMDFDKKIYTDDYIDVTIPAKYGDILTGVTLSFNCDKSKLPGIIDGLVPLGSVGQLGEEVLMYVIEKFGISVIEYVELLLGDQIIDKLTGDDIFIYNELNVPDSYGPSLDIMHGPSFTYDQGNLFPIRQQVDGQYFSTLYNNGNIDTEFRIQLPFYFHNRPKNGFPLCAINKQELKVRIKLRSARETIFIAGEKAYSNGLGGNETEANIPLRNIWHPMAEKRIARQFELDDFTVNLDLVHLNKTERCKIQSKPMNLLIEQHQQNIFSIEPQSKFGEFNLDFKNPVKDMYFIAKKNEQWSDSQISLLDQMRGITDSAHTSGGFQSWQRSILGKKPVPHMYTQQKLVTLKCDGISILNETTGSSMFMSVTIPNTYYKRSPYARNINVYSFALQPGQLEPSGHLDFSLIKDAKLTMELPTDGSHQDSTNPNGVGPIYFRKQVIILAKSYNVIHIDDGIGKILF